MMEDESQALLVVENFDQWYRAHGQHGPSAKWTRWGDGSGRESPRSRGRAPPQRQQPAGRSDHRGRISLLLARGKRPRTQRRCQERRLEGSRTALPPRSDKPREYAHHTAKKNNPEDTHRGLLTLLGEHSRSIGVACDSSKPRCAHRKVCHDPQRALDNLALSRAAAHPLRSKPALRVDPRCDPESDRSRSRPSGPEEIWLSPARLPLPRPIIPGG